MASRTSKAPFIVHNNWCDALAQPACSSKVERARAFGVWFLLPNGTCDEGQVAAALRRGLPDPAGFERAAKMMMPSERHQVSRSKGNNTLSGLNE